MPKGMKQKLRRLQEKVVAVKWLPKLKHGNYNTSNSHDSVHRIRLSNKTGRVEY